MSYDPLIHGPNGKEGGAKPPSAASLGLMNLDETSPPQDFIAMLRSPARFFDSVPFAPQPYLTAKAFVGAVLLVMLAKFASMGFKLGANFESLETYLPELVKHSQIKNPFMGPVLVQMESQLKTAMAMMGHLSILLIPLALVSAIFMKALSLRIFLPLMSSVKAEEVSFRRMLVILSFPKWLSIFAVIPFTSWLVSLGVFAFTINALRSTFRIHWFKAFLAYVLLDFFVNLILIALALIFVLTLTMG